MEPVLDVGLPVFAILAIGWVAGRFGPFGANATNVLNDFVYWIAFPALIFRAMATAPLSATLDVPFLAAYSAGVFGTFVVAFVVGLIAFPNRPAALCLQAMAVVFANTGYMGVPLLMSAFGDPGVLPALVLTVYNAAFLVAVFVILIELDLRSEEPPLRVLAGVARAVALNPLVLAALAGVAWAATAEPLPTPIDNFCAILGAAAAPAALVAMGLFLVGKPIRAGLREVAWLVSLKLLLQPAITAWIAFGPLALGTLQANATVLSAALPTGSLVFVLAYRYRLYVERVTATILISTVLSVVTVSALLLMLDIG
ncbi:MAG: AEC family transporter [Alphaproteobacteria bacterium]|nr:AEC family transporter [Alphaproteobacteria bacterium]